MIPSAADETLRTAPVPASMWLLPGPARAASDLRCDVWKMLGVGRGALGAGGLPDELAAEAAEFFAAGFVVGHGVAEGGPEGGGVVGVQKMGKLMRDDVVE